MNEWETELAFRLADYTTPRRVTASRDTMRYCGGASPGGPATSGPSLGV